VGRGNVPGADSSMSRTLHAAWHASQNNGRNLAVVSGHSGAIKGAC